MERTVMLNKMKKNDNLVIVCLTFCILFIVTLTVLGKVDAPLYFNGVLLVFNVIAIFITLINKKYKKEMINAVNKSFNAVYNDDLSSIENNSSNEIYNLVNVYIKEIEDVKNDLDTLLKLTRAVEKDEISDFNLTSKNKKVSSAIRVVKALAVENNSNRKITTEFFKNVKTGKYNDINVDSDNIMQQQLNAVLHNMYTLNTNLRVVQSAIFEGDYDVEIITTGVDGDFLNVINKLNTLVQSAKKSSYNLNKAILMMDEDNELDFAKSLYKGHLVTSFKLIEMVYENLRLSVDNIVYALESSEQISTDNVSELFNPIIKVISNENFNIINKDSNNYDNIENKINKSTLNNIVYSDIKKQYTGNYEIIESIENSLSDLKATIETSEFFNHEESVEENTEDTEKVLEVVEENTEDTEKVLEVVEENTEDTEKVLEVVEENTEDTEKVLEVIEENTEDTEKVLEVVEENTEDTEKVLEVIEENTEDTEKVLEVIEENTEDTEKVLEVVEENAEDTEKVLEVVEENTEDIDEAYNSINYLNNNEIESSIKEKELKELTKQENISFEDKNQNAILKTGSRQIKKETKKSKKNKKTYNEKRRTEVSGLSQAGSSSKKPLTYQEALKSGQIEELTKNKRKIDTLSKNLANRSLKEPMTYQKFLDTNGTNSSNTSNTSSENFNSNTKAKKAKRSMESLISSSAQARDDLMKQESEKRERREKLQTQSSLFSHEPVKTEKPKSTEVNKSQKVNFKEKKSGESDSLKRRTRIEEKMGRKFTNRERNELDMYGEILDDKYRTVMETITNESDLGGF